MTDSDSILAKISNKEAEDLIIEDLRMLVENAVDNDPSFEPFHLNIGCTEAENDHEESFRQFAHVFHDDTDTICVVFDLGRLTQNFRLGILAHEIGHHLSVSNWGDESEESADAASKEFLDLEIEYVGELNLESLCPEDVNNINHKYGRHYFENDL